MSEFDDLIPEFIEESMEHLKNIEEDIILIENGSADNELINKVFRAVHSIKGGSSFLGLKNIEHLSHKMEDIFNLVRNNDLVFTSSISSVILKSIDQLKDMLENVEQSENVDIKPFINELDDCLKDTKLDTKVKEDLTLKTGKDELKIDKYTFENYKNKGKKIYLIRLTLNDKKHKNPLDYFKEIEKTGEIICSCVDIESVLNDENFSGEGIPLKIIYATVLEKDLVAHSFELDSKYIMEIKEDDFREEIKNTNKIEKKQEIKNEPIEHNFEEEYEEIEEEIKDINEFLTFYINEEEYAFKIDQVQESITLLPITPIPNSDNFTKGIINLRGDILPVYDFRLKLEFEEKEYTNETIILIVKVKEKKMGIIVDSVSEVIELKRDEIKPAPNIQQFPPDYLLGIGQKEGKFIFLLNINEIFKQEEIA